MKKKILIVLWSVKYNRGSEALVRGFSEICKNTYKDSEIYLSSAELDFEKTVVIPNIYKNINKYSYNTEKSIKRYFIGIIDKVFKLKGLAQKMRYKKFLNVCKEMDLIVVIGADNYDKSYGMFSFMHETNKMIKENSNAKLLMYDCSLEENDIDDNIISDFAMFDGVTARESITYNNFRKKLKNKVLGYYPDPAFLLKPEEYKLPIGWKKNNMVGINVSSLITNDIYGTGYDLVMNSYYELIENILNKTDMNIVLVPHVMNNADLSVLKKLYLKYENSGRVILIDNELLNAAQLKYIISRCRFYIGARTHSTIAAYSSCVPTLVLGYSIKSIGIARDIFGREDNYVISVSKVKDKYELSNAFKWIMKNEDAIRKHLEEYMPMYVNKAMNTKEMIIGMLGEK